MTFRQYVRRDGAWDRERFRRMKPTTRKRVRSALRRQLLPAFGGSEMESVLPADVCRWFDAYSRTAPGGANRDLDTLRAICRHAVEAGVIAADPTRRTDRNPRRPVTRYLDRAEIARLHEALDAYRGRRGAQQQVDIIRLLLLTGCRKSEIVRLRWSEVGDDGALRLRDSKTGPRTVWLGGEARAVLDTQPRPRRTWVFPDLRPSRRGRPRPADLCAWSYVRKAAGIEDVRLHDLRHTFASQAVLAGVPLPVVSRLLGHSSTRMTMRYAHVGDRESRRAAERIGSALKTVLEDPRG